MNMKKTKGDCLKAAMMALASAESQKYSDIIDHQTRVISLLVTEAQQRAQNLMELIGKLNRLADKAHSEQLDLFEHLDKSADEMYTFTQLASAYYPDSTKFLSGTCHSTEAFNVICEGVFGYNDKGLEVPNRRVILCTAQEADEFGKWLEKHKKLSDHMKRNAAEAMYEDEKSVSLAGWNAEGVVMYNEDGEWREFNSVAEAKKLTGYSESKIRRAMKGNTEYMGYKWVTRDTYKRLQNKDKFGHSILVEEGKK